MAKTQRHFKAKVKRVKLKATPEIEDDEIVVMEPTIVVTLELRGTKMNVRLMDFLHSAEDQKEVDVTVESSQLELAL